MIDGEKEYIWFPFSYGYCVGEAQQSLGMLEIAKQNKIAVIAFENHDDLSKGTLEL